MVLAIIQARIGSSRLPGKVLADIAGKPLLGHVIQRIQACHTVNEIVVATTAAPEDQGIMTLARQCGARTFSGSSTDVLDRYYQAASSISADIIVRVTADDPFKDPQVTDRIVDYLLTHPQFDYVSNTIEPTYPEGLDVEVFTFDALERSWREAHLPSQREHVTPYIWNNSHCFNVLNIKHNRDLSHMRWTVDYAEDLCFAREIYRRLYDGQVFLMENILSVLQSEPALMQINAGFVRNEGYLCSVIDERAVGKIQYQER
jgi:spore coat polysaccharide biosynthesis protein SpsF